MALILPGESKEKLKKYKEILSKIKVFIRPSINKPCDYDENYIKIKFNLDDHLLLKNPPELHDMIIVARSAFNDGSKLFTCL